MRVLSRVIFVSALILVFFIPASGLHADTLKQRRIDDPAERKANEEAEEAARKAVKEGAPQPVRTADDPSKTIFNLMNNPLPEIKLLPQKAFEEATQEIHETPFDDKSLEYRVRLPKGWTKKVTADVSKLGVSQGVLGEVAAYVSPPRLEDARSEFRVQALSLSYDIAASHWFLQHVLANAYNIEGIKEHNESRVEGLYVVVRDDTTFVVRAVAIKNGKRIILAEFFVPQGQWEAERVLQAQGMAEFQLLNADKSYVQPLKTYKFLDISQFSYPERWELRTPTIKSTERMQARLINVNREFKVLNGQIEIYMVAASVVETLEDELLNFKKILEKKGLSLGKLIDVPQDFKFDPHMKFGVVESYAATNTQANMLEYELWIAIMSDNTYYYFVPMITPMRTEDFLTWARNVGDFRIVVETTKPVTDKPGLEDAKTPLKENSATGAAKDFPQEKAAP